MQPHHKMQDIFGAILVGFVSVIIAIRIASSYRPARVREMMPVARNVSEQVTQFVPPMPTHIETNSVMSMLTPIVSEESSLVDGHGRAHHTQIVLPSPNAQYSRTLPANASNGEKMCAKICREIFGDEEALYNYRDVVFANCDTGRALEFDIFYPARKIAIEFDGRQHFENVAVFGNKQSSQAARDHNKRIMAQRKGVHLVSIPYTYDENKCREFLRKALS